jgi:hypothetical protein
MFSKSEILATATERLLKQNAKSTGDGGASCLYHSPSNGLRCGVGLLLDPAIPTKSFEGVGCTAVLHIIDREEELNRLNVRGVKLQGALLMSEIDSTDRYTVLLLTRIQNIHDHTDPSTWAASLADLKLRLNEGEYGDPNK